MRNVNDAITDKLLRHQIYLLRHAASESEAAKALLMATESDVETVLFKFLRSNSTLNSKVDWVRLSDMLDQVKAIRSESWDTIGTNLNSGLTTLAIDEGAFMAAAVTAAMPVVVDLALPLPGLLKSIVDDRPFEGRVLKDWVAKLEESDVSRIGNAVKMGMVQGESIDAIIERVMGSASAGGKGGAIAMAHNDVEAIVRTAVMHVSNDAHHEFYRENQDISNKEMFLATLDSRTSSQCRAYDHKIYNFNEGPHPVLHLRCRSVRTPVVDGFDWGDRPMRPTTEKQIVRDFLKTMPDAVTDSPALRATPAYQKFRAKTMRDTFGRVEATTSYQEWLTKQPQWFQEDVLGIQKAKLFRDGGLKLDQFIDMKSGEEFTLAQLREKHPKIFTKTGL